MKQKNLLSLVQKVSTPIRPRACRWNWPDLCCTTQHLACRTYTATSAHWGLGPCSKEAVHPVSPGISTLWLKKKQFGEQDKSECMYFDLKNSAGYIVRNRLETILWRWDSSAVSLASEKHWFNFQPFSNCTNGIRKSCKTSKIPRLIFWTPRYAWIVKLFPRQIEFLGISSGLPRGPRVSNWYLFLTFDH